MQLGLIGQSLKHSFSRKYFQDKFRRESLSGYDYQNFELSQAEEFPVLLSDHPNLKGLNVTVPYKSAVIPYLDQLSDDAKTIGAVNTIRIKNGQTTGFNTDHIAFRASLEPLIVEQPAKKVLILGSGGASKAVQYALQQMDIPSFIVSRTAAGSQLSYKQAAQNLGEYQLVINCTPVGTSPTIHEMPPLSMDNVSENHLFYDLIYNPEKSRFLKEAESKGAGIKNGYEMLVLQAEAAWQIWHED